MQAADVDRAFAGRMKAAAAAAPRSGRLVVAGGGTGGHLFPGIAIAREFMARHPENAVCFVSTGNQFERVTLLRTGFKLKTIIVAGIKGRGLWQKVKSVMLVPVGIFQSIWIMRHFKPDLVLGVGSYAAGPVVLAAWLIGIPVVLHEQNILPGITNRFLSRFAGRIYVSFENTLGGFEKTKVRLTGNPVRREILQAATGAASVEAASAPSKDFLTILIVGGSQGAHAINMAVVDALPLLTRMEGLRFVHQTGAADEIPVRTAYENLGITATVGAFFEDMDRKYLQADLIICRAGATTVAEITAIGKAALFIPFPFAADDHQKLNAAALSSSGAAELIDQKDLNPEDLARRIDRYAVDREALKKMALKAQEFGKPEAARLIVDDIYRMMGGTEAIPDGGSKS